MSPSDRVTPVDAHVHLHHASRAAKVFDNAMRHFAKIRPATLGGIQGCLLLTDSAVSPVTFSQLLDYGRLDNWSIRESFDEPQSAIASGPCGKLAIVAGRQIRTAEGLEVHALGTTRHYPDDMDLAATISAVYESGATVVLPWGFGKWTGQRLQLLHQLLEWVLPEALFLGDNGGRLGLIDAPPLLTTAINHGFRILPGSDPLPLPGDWRRVGSFGFCADLDLPERDPWRVLRDWLNSRRNSPVPYGKPTGLGRFMFNQLGIHVYKRWHRDQS